MNDRRSLTPFLKRNIKAAHRRAGSQGEQRMFIKKSKYIELSRIAARYDQAMRAEKATMSRFRFCANCEHGMEMHQPGEHNLIFVCDVKSPCEMFLRKQASDQSNNGNGKG